MTIEENDSFDPLTICPDTPFTQVSFYGEWQKSLGREARSFVIRERERVISCFQLIKYPFFRDKSYLYIPYGPIIEGFSEHFLKFLKIELVKIAKENKAVFVRLDFTPSVSSAILSKFFTKAPLYTYHSAYFQPRTEWFLGLEKTKDELLTAMHEKTRYSIRLAKRKGITAEIITEDFGNYFESFYELMVKTAKRNGFSLHSKTYYQNMFQTLEPDRAYLVVARYGEKILVIDLIIHYGPTANYVFGGSSSEHRNFCASSLAQWRAIIQAKNIGCENYNFGGVATDKIYKGWDGLTRFKKRFGGHEVSHSDFFDIVAQPFWYHLYNFRKFILKLTRG